MDEVMAGASPSARRIALQEVLKVKDEIPNRAWKEETRCLVVDLLQAPQARFLSNRAQGLLLP